MYQKLQEWMQQAATFYRNKKNVEKKNPQLSMLIYLAQATCHAINQSKRLQKYFLKTFELTKATVCVHSKHLEKLNNLKQEYYQKQYSETCTSQICIHTGWAFPMHEILWFYKDKKAKIFVLRK